jgi:hypothetical protein
MNQEAGGGSRPGGVLAEEISVESEFVETHESVARAGF